MFSKHKITISFDDNSIDLKFKRGKASPHSVANFLLYTKEEMTYDLEQQVLEQFTQEEFNQILDTLAAIEKLLSLATKNKDAPAIHPLNVLGGMNEREKN